MSFQCHYEILSVDRDADFATIKKAHRKLAIKYHPDKNLGKSEQAADQFRLVQEAYECLSDVGERKWYDEHRDALLKGWSPSAGGAQEDGVSMLFDVIPFMHAHCYTGYADNDDQSFYAIYGHVFASLAKEEADAAESNNISEQQYQHLPANFGNSQTVHKETVQFYSVWEGFVSRQTFSWADQYDLKEADNRRIRRAMEEENKKSRKQARKARNEDIVALVRFCKRRDPRMKAHKAKQEQEKANKEKEQAEFKRIQKQEKQQAREKWKQQAEEEMAQAEEMDRLAGRVRLADLEDDYDYGGGKKKGRKGKKGKKQQQVVVEESDDERENEEGEDLAPDGESELPDESADDDAVATDNTKYDTVEQTGFSENEAKSNDNISSDEDNESAVSSSEGEVELDVFRCECCRKDFKSQGQMDNHMKSKKHKETFKKYQRQIEKEMMAA